MQNRNSPRAGVQRVLRVMGLALAMMLLAGQARADLMLFPTRVVFEKNQRAAQIDLNNNGTETTTYRITLVNRRMSESGEFSLIDSPRPGELFADDLLRYSPRQVVLVPGAGQTIRISLRKPADLPAGEYRSHLQFDRVPDSGGASSIAGAALAAGEVGVQLKLLVGASIPIIVRHGETAASVTLSELELLQPVGNQVALASVVLQRSGNRSVYGDLGASFTPRGGTAQEVGKAAGLAVYSPNPLRRVRLELKPPAGQPLAHGTLHLSFRERPEAGGKLIAEAAIELP